MREFYWKTVATATSVLRWRHGIVTSFVDHLGAYMVQPGKIHTLADTFLFPLRLHRQIFFIAELYTVCPVCKAHALVSVMLVILISPSAIYKKSGLAFHVALDTSCHA